MIGIIIISVIVLFTISLAVFLLNKCRKPNDATITKKITKTYIQTNKSPQIIPLNSSSKSSISSIQTAPSESIMKSEMSSKVTAKEFRDLIDNSEPQYDTLDVFREDIITDIVNTGETLF